MSAHGTVMATGLERADPQPRRAVTRARDYDGAHLLDTHRLTLRGLRLVDVADLSTLHQEVSVRSLLLEPVPLSFLEIAGLIIQANRVYANDTGLGTWHASDREGRFIGLFSLMRVGDGPDVELGARLLPSSGGRLYSLEGARALRDHAFETVGLPRLVGFCHPDNHAVPAIFARLGFSAAGETRHFGQRALHFVLNRENWSARRARATSTNPRGHS